VAGAYERYRQADVNFWGVAAIACVGIAIVGASVGAFIPPNALAGLHGTRMDGGTLNELRAKVASMERQTNQIRFDNARLSSIVNLGDQDATSMARRVAALENTLPTLLERLPPGTSIDLSNTAAIGKSPQTTPTEGGSVAVTTRPMNTGGGDNAVPALDEPMPAMPGTKAESPAANTPDLAAVSTDGYGVAMGPVVSIDDAFIAWTGIRDKVGALLIGLKPILVSDVSGSYRVVAGPLPAVAQAESLCTHITRVGIDCLPVRYSGYALPQ